MGRLQSEPSLQTVVIMAILIPLMRFARWSMSWGDVAVSVICIPFCVESFLSNFISCFAMCSATEHQKAVQHDSSSPSKEYPTTPEFLGRSDKVESHQASIHQEKNGEVNPETFRLSAMFHGCPGMLRACHQLSFHSVIEAFMFSHQSLRLITWPVRQWMKCGLVVESLRSN